MDPWWISGVQLVLATILRVSENGASPQNGNLKKGKMMMNKWISGYLICTHTEPFNKPNAKPNFCGYRYLLMVI